MMEVSRPQDNAAKNAPAESGTRNIQITAKLPDTEPSEMAKPAYPPAIHVGGKAVIRIKVDEVGDVVSARGLSGHPLLKPLALDAARKSKFKPNSSQGKRPVTGTITYVFTPAEISYDELPGLIGQPVTLRGKFSLYGKLGSVLEVEGHTVYIISERMFAERRYEPMQDKIVSVTGTLRFFKAPPQPDFIRGVAIPKTPDHFYFKAERASIQLTQWWEH